MSFKIQGRNLFLLEQLISLRSIGALFCLGILIAFVLAQLLSLIGNSKLQSPANLSRDTSSLDNIPSNQTEMPAIDPKGYGFQKRAALNDEDNEILLAQISQDLKSRPIDELDFSLLRSDFLSKDPVAELASLSHIKDAILYRLVMELANSDWLQWAEEENYSGSSSIRKNRRAKGNLSSARKFINKLRVVNFQLGRYAETSALLFSSLYANSMAGRKFSVEEELYNLLMEADQIFKERALAAVSSRMHLDAEISQDEVFAKWLERLRAEFVIKHMENAPKQFETNFYLLSSIRHVIPIKEIENAYDDLLRRSVTEISPRYREELRGNLLVPDRVREILSRYPSLRDRMENFYYTSLEDKILERDVSAAKGVYLQLSALFPDSANLERLKIGISDLEKSLNAGLHGLDETFGSNVRSTSTNEVSINKDSSGNSLNGKKSVFDLGDNINRGTSSLVSLIERLGLIVLLVLALVVLVIKKKKSLAFFVNRIGILRKSHTNTGKKVDLDSEEKPGIRRFHSSDITSSSAKTNYHEPAETDDYGDYEAGEYASRSSRMVALSAIEGKKGSKTRRESSFKPKAVNL
ncbi:MAG TPA: hypothetical protein PKA63_04250 [Oligoflexia bacterium]|nr:hypothetical protein [Oligoflexia bacterium]HMP47861.1 hypothetical protein [Oligoflexia bacterium]